MGISCPCSASRLISASVLDWTEMATVLVELQLGHGLFAIAAPFVPLDEFVARVAELPDRAGLQACDAARVVLSHYLLALMTISSQSGLMPDSCTLPCSRSITALSRSPGCMDLYSICPDQPVM